MSGYLGSMTMAVANHLWQSTLVVGVAWLLTLLLRTNTARTRQRIWLAASLKFLLPFSLLVAAGSHMVHPKPITRSSPAFYAAMDQWTQPAPALAAAVQPRPAGLSTSGALRRIFRGAVPTILAMVWLLGSFVIVSLWSVRWRRLLRVKRATMPMPEGRETAALLRVQQRTGFHSAVRLLRVERQTGRRMEPGVIGIRRQVLLWPDGISQRLSDEQMETIFAHEMQHVKHRDNLVAMLHMAVEAIFWFHPLVWWMETRLVEERERACDEEVLRLGSKPGIYAQSILKTCEFCLESPMACVAGVTGGELKKRIAQIMSQRLGRELSLTSKVLLASVAALVTTGPMVFGLVYASQVRAQSAKKYSFDVVSVRMNTTGNQRSQRGATADGYHLTHLPPVMAIIDAYVPSHGTAMFNVKTVIGAPAWLLNDRYDIDAKVAESDAAMWQRLPTQKPMMQGMLQMMLADRFKLAVHREDREEAVYDLTVDKDGPKFKSAEITDAAALKQKYPNSRPMPGSGIIVLSSDPGEITIYGASMESLALLLQGTAGRAIQDKTGLAGRYDITLHLNAENADGSRPTPEETAAQLFSAMQEQLGLRLDPAKGPVEFLVIDHVERPTEN